MLILEVFVDMQESENFQRNRPIRFFRWKKFVPPLLILMLLAGFAWPVHQALYAHNQSNSNLVTAGAWSQHNYDLVYAVAFSSAQRPDGPLVAYRASAGDLHTAVPVVAVQRDSGGSEPASTPLFFPDPAGHYLALLTPLGMDDTTNLNGASLRLYSTDGQSQTLLAAQGIAGADRPVWSADGTALYYHTGVVTENVPATGQAQAKSAPEVNGYEEIRRLDLTGQTTLLWRRPVDSSSIQLLGLDKTGDLIMSLARPNAPVELLRLSVQSRGTQTPTVIATLPADILPGNILGIGADGQSVDCLRVTQWQPLSTEQIQIGFNGQVVGQVQPLFATSRFGAGLQPLARSADGDVVVMSQVTATRSDLAAQGIANVPQQENLVVADASTGASQHLSLPSGGQLIQAFWSAHVPLQQVHTVAPGVMQQIFTAPAVTEQSSNNANTFQQDEWMLEAHANQLSTGPKLPTMCYGDCAHGLSDPPHISAAILHGVGYTESNWHQFNTSGYQVNGEAIGTPVKSFDGGWGEYQQTWGMPPQCQQASNCRSDAAKIQNSEAYNIGVGAASLISEWNTTAGVVSSTDPNDPLKANDWFFAVWGYNGASGNNPADIPSTQYAHWYPGAPFRSVYEEYVWYFAAHPQSASNHWTDNYLPSLGTALLPPQSDFQDTSDSFVHCVTCTIPDWTAGTFDRNWVGQGASQAGVTAAFQQIYQQKGGENIVGLPIDDGGGAAVHHWGSGSIQNMDGGSFRPGAFMLADGSNTVYWIYGGIWTRYKQDQGAVGCHGYPISALALTTSFNANSGTDTYYTQTFQHGSIVWDSTNASIAQDAC
jgi:hypothetical protein